MMKKMNRTLIFGLLIAGIMAFSLGCDDDDTVFDPRPQPPQGVFSITGDQAVTLWWAYPYDRDIDEFWIYRAQSPDDQPPSQYEFLFAVEAVDNPDLDLIWDYVTDGPIPNGTTYWYAIASVDHAGQVSELNAEDIWDTPRPEGAATLTDFRVDVNTSGLSFDSQTVIVSAGSILCDVYVDEIGGILYFSAGDTLSFRNTNIQDMGYTADWDDIGWAPPDGWSNYGYVEVIQGHTYVVWTEDKHFAKLQVMEVDQNFPPTWVRVRWAYQLQQYNPELAPEKPQEDNKERVAKAVALAK